MVVHESEERREAMKSSPYGRRKSPGLLSIGTTLKWKEIRSDIMAGARFRSPPKLALPPLFHLDDQHFAVYFHVLSCIVDSHGRASLGGLLKRAPAIGDGGA